MTSAKLHLPPDTTRIGEARRFVARTLEPLEVDELFLVAVTEVITNAIEEHRRIGCEAPVTIDIDVDAGTVRIADVGRGYASAAVPTPHDLLADRGRGLMIAQAITPTMTWEPNQPTGTVFTLPHP